MNLGNLAGMFSQRSGVQQSMGNSIMSTDNWIYGTKDDGTRNRKYTIWWWQ